MTPLSPFTLEIMVLLTGILLLLVEPFTKSTDKRWVANTALFWLISIFAFSFFAQGNPANTSQPPWNFYSADPLAMYFKRIALATTILVLIMSIEYRSVLTRFIPGGDPGAGVGEFYALPVLTCAGLMFMASAVDFVFIFVALELVTVSFYVMVAFMRKQPASLEAGVKYLILGALSTGFFVYGIAWVFGVTGQTNLRTLAEILPTWHGNETALLFGLMMMLVGLGFKVAATPFQLWVPDVYQGAPTPVTAFLSVGSKAAGFIVLMRVLQPFFALPHVAAKLLTVIGIMAALSLLYGNLAAMPQDNFKRLLAYSSIGHAGYLLLGVASVSVAPELMFGSSGPAIAYYLAGYLLMTLLAFLILVVVAKHSRGDDIVHFNGLSKRSPFLAFGMLVAMLSLAGIPFTAGFYGKFFIFAAAWKQQQYLLVGIGVLTVAAGFYYYLRVVTAMYWQDAGDETPIEANLFTRAAVAGLVILIVFFGLFPNTLLSAFRAAPAPSTGVAAITSAEH
jgi:NADH-quinone oxidoreductase subunit N